MKKFLRSYIGLAIPAFCIIVVAMTCTSCSGPKEAQASKPKVYDTTTTTAQSKTQTATAPKQQKVRKGTGLKVASALGHVGAAVTAASGHPREAIIIDAAATSADILLYQTAGQGTIPIGGYYGLNPPARNTGGYVLNR